MPAADDHAPEDEMTVRNRPAVLDTARLPLSFEPRHTMSDGSIESNLVDQLGVVTLPITRWLDVWNHVRWLLPTWDRLHFTMQHQQQTKWCWAATSTSIALYYDPSSSWTQCGVANAQTGRSDCCGAGAAGACNQYGYLDRALQTVAHLSYWAAGAAVFQGVDDEVDAGRPMGIRVAWSGGGAHFLAVVGYLEDAVNYVAVDDPIYGQSDVSYEILKTKYQGSGTWTHTFYTKA